MEALVHIGTPKTGTSSIQRYLADHEALLRDRGLYFPRAGRSHGERSTTRQVGLALSILPDDRQDIGFDRIFRLDSRKKKAAFRKRFVADLAAEISANPGRRFVFSDEALYLFLSTPAYPVALCDFLSRWFARVRIAVYVRSPDSHVESAYSQHLKMGGTESLEDYARKPGRNLFFATRLRLWRDAFGEEAIAVREFDRARLHRGDVVADFFREMLGIEREIELPPREANSSLTPLGQALLLAVNRHFAARGEDRPRFYRGYVSRNFAGTGARLDAGQVAALAEALKDEIGDLSREFFGGRPIFGRMHEPRDTGGTALPDQVAVTEAAIAMSEAALRRANKDREAKIDGPESGE